jgi:adenylate kinase
VPPEELIGRFAVRRICRAAGHVYNLRSNPPRMPGVCDVDGSELVQRADDAEATVRARMREQLPPLEAVTGHYRDAGVLLAVDGRSAIVDVTTQLLAAVDAAAQRPLGTAGAGQ